MTCGVCGVTDCITGVFVVDVNLELSVLVCYADETYYVSLCLAPSKVKYVYAPSEVHCCALFRWGGGTILFVFRCVPP
jgi:hypothetical protein